MRRIYWALGEGGVIATGGVDLLLVSPSGAYDDGDDISIGDGGDWEGRGATRLCLRARRQHPVSPRPPRRLHSIPAKYTDVLDRIG